MRSRLGIPAPLRRLPKGSRVRHGTGPHCGQFAGSAMWRSPCIHGRVIGSANRDRSRSGRPLSRTTPDRTWRRSLNNAAHARIRGIDLTGEVNFSLSARVRNRDGVPQLGGIDTGKCFPISCHGSSCCDEDRPGPPEQHSHAQCRASRPTGRGGHTGLPHKHKQHGLMRLLKPLGMGVLDHLRPFLLFRLDILPKFLGRASR